MARFSHYRFSFFLEFRSGSRRGHRGRVSNGQSVKAAPRFRRLTENLSFFCLSFHATFDFPSAFRRLNRSHHPVAPPLPVSMELNDDNNNNNNSPCTSLIGCPVGRLFFSKKLSHSRERKRRGTERIGLLGSGTPLRGRS